MKKYDYQTCLRLPVILKEEMTTICDNYQINESDLMRRAISEFVQTINANPQDNGKLMFVWYVRYTLSEWGFSYQTDIPRTLHVQETSQTPCWGVFFVDIGWSELRVRETCIWGVSYLRCNEFSPWPQRVFTGKSTQTPHSPNFLSKFPYEKSNHHHLPKPCSWLQYECYLGNIG